MAYKKINDLKAMGPPPQMPKIDPINPPAPNTTYRSQISVAPPISRSQEQLLTRMPNVAGKSYDNSAAGLTRGVFAQSLLDSGADEMRQNINKLNVAQQTQAEKSRAEDILSQRQNSHDRFRMDIMRDIFEADTHQRFISGVKDLKAQYAREKKNAQASVTASILGGL